MWEILSEFLLICHFSLIFSLTILCSVFFIRTRDKIVLRLLIILYALFVHVFACLFFYMFSDALSRLIGDINSAIMLFLLVVTSMTVPLIIYGTSSYMLSLLSLSRKREKICRRIITICSLIFFLFGLYIIVFLNGSNWYTGLSRALNELFLYGSLFLLLPAVAAAVFQGKTGNRRNRQLLRGIIIAFIPVGVFAVLDLLYFLSSPYKLVYISYFIFAILVYLFTARYYIHRYDPEAADISVSIAGFCRAADISGREEQLIPYLIEGRANREIADSLCISPNTVKTHIRNIYRKAGVSNRLQLLSRIKGNPKG